MEALGQTNKFKLLYFKSQLEWIMSMIWIVMHKEDGEEMAGPVSQPELDLTQPGKQSLTPRFSKVPLIERNIK